MNRYWISCLFPIVASSFSFAAAEQIPASDLQKIQAQLATLQQTVQKLSATIQDQQKTIAELQRAQTVPVSEAPPAKAATGPYLPEIGVVGDFTAISTESSEDEEGNDRLSVRELELVFGHDVDPYSRFDAIVTFSDLEDPDIEVAKVSYWDLPFDLQGQIGRMRQKVGKASALHRDALETVDEPLVVQRYFGVEGLFRTGLELSGFTPLSEDSFTQQLTAGIMEGGVGEDGELFGDTRRRPSYYAHLGHFLELGDLDNFELGGTYLLGSSDDDSGNEVNAFGVDAAYAHFFTPIQKFKLQSEAYFQHRDESGDFDSTPWGVYALADYRLSERFGLGTRYDFVEPTELDPSSERDADQAISGYLTFFQSEFARWRAQYQYAELAEGGDDNRFFLQGTFAIGTHKHQLQ